MSATQPYDPTMPPEWDGPSRPLDTWRICGRHTDTECSCAESPWGPDSAVVVVANKRLRGEL